MRVNVETLTMRIERLKQQLRECPPEQAKHIIQTLPQVLSDLENTIRSNNPAIFDQINETLKKTEVMLTWAIGTVKGKITGDAIKAGKETDQSLPTHERLLNRITKFMFTKIDGPTYTSKIQEFAGNEAVKGDKVYMDPIGESEAFSQWILYDICFPGQDQRFIDLFDKEFSDELPDDERDLLKLRQDDRPSVYKVINIGDNAQGIYLVQDLLAPNNSFRIWDVSSSKTLKQGSIILGRVIPYDSRSSDLYTFLGTLTGLPEKLWALLLPDIEKWKQQFFKGNPDATTVSFFRANHARLRRRIIEITGPGEPIPEIEISLADKKIAAEIHKFVIKRKKNGTILSF
ncbi:MAG: hypothetical protein OMM_04076 [Candidatus Magnetoglobus multicellularis str. Araruama]|uniref:Uncharacterized protein n=1 Tax=Candidatus Magnetoglobus multicellularis str. Araruama TaxID=890399 RepID=A0A1V1P327_9BACT|nr:MAG: hypothetical protein OMM_04076 [Candidatus Magnetoglobus multicellularis str. Araruama]